MDAVGRTISAVGARLSALREEERPGQIIFLIITDGQENSSKEFMANAVKEMVKHQTEKYNWRFVYLGGGDIESQRQQGEGIGVQSANVYNYSANTVGTKNVYANLSRGVTRSREQFRLCGEAPGASAALLSEEEALDLLASPEKV